MSEHYQDAQGYMAPNWPPPWPLPDGDAPIIIYGYLPSFGFAVFGLVIFAISCIVHSVQVFRYRCWYFIPVALGCLFEVIGYIFRMLSAKSDPYRVIYFVLQYVFIVVAPVLYSASIYTILSVLVKKVGRQYSPLSPKILLWIFISADVVCTIIQAAGSAIVGVRESNQEDPKTGNDILLAGLAIQVFTFALFLLFYGVFIWRARKVLGRKGLPAQKPTSHATDFDKEAGTENKSPMRRVSMGFLIALTVATLAVYMRTLYRLSETAQYNYGSKAHNVKEYLFGILEFAPIVVCVYLLIIWHPGRVLGRA